MKRIAIALTGLILMIAQALALEPAATEDDAVRVVREAGLGKVLKVEALDDVFRVRVLTPDGIVKNVDVPRKGG